MRELTVIVELVKAIQQFLQHAEKYYYDHQLLICHPIYENMVIVPKEVMEVIFQGSSYNIDQISPITASEILLTSTNRKTWGADFSQLNSRVNQAKEFHVADLGLNVSLEIQYYMLKEFQNLLSLKIEEFYLFSSGGWKDGKLGNLQYITFKELLTVIGTKEKSTKQPPIPNADTTNGVPYNQRLSSFIKELETISKQGLSEVKLKQKLTELMDTLEINETDRMIYEASIFGKIYNIPEKKGGFNNRNFIFDLLSRIEYLKIEGPSLTTVLTQIKNLGFISEDAFHEYERKVFGSMISNNNVVPADDYEQIKKSLHDQNPESYHTLFEVKDVATLTTGEIALEGKIVKGDVNIGDWLESNELIPFKVSKIALRKKLVDCGKEGDLVNLVFKPGNHGEELKRAKLLQFKSYSIELNDVSYQGDMIAGNKQGFGTYKTKDYYVEGNWFQDELNGEAKIVLNDGRVLTGIFQGYQIVKNGKMTFNDEDGTYYTGDFNDFEMHGQGKMVFGEKAVITGKFKNNEIVDGKITHRDGRYYKGTFKNFNYHGKGMFRSTEGIEYIGEWKNGKRHGKGVEITVDGKKKEGIWENDILINPISSNTQPVQTAKNPNHNTELKQTKSSTIADKKVNLQVVELSKQTPPVKAASQPKSVTQAKQEVATAQAISSGINNKRKINNNKTKNTPAKKENGFFWGLFHSLWLIWVFTFGFLSFISFLYIGFRAKEKKWIFYGIFYCIPVVTYVYLIDKGRIDSGLLILLLFSIGLFSLIHAFRLRKPYLQKISK